MQVRTRHTPTFGVARLVLAPSEGVQTCADAMLATSYGIGVQRAAGTAFGQLAKSWKDAEICTAPAEGGWVDVVPGLPGDIHVLDLDGTTGWCLAKDSWLAAASTVRLAAGWAGYRAMFGGDVGFLAHADGSGPAVLACFGALDLVTLAPGELVTVNPGHVVAFPESVQCRLRAVHPASTQSVRTGEGLVLDFAGPGQLVTQTRALRTMATRLAGHVPVAR
ncbi:MAG TPA: AIM24 family protein [Pseudonocardiaceae bacterium]|nr:AIM24 family protein [Pseudonocardiaceae bacterium]